MIAYFVSWHFYFSYTTQVGASLVEKVLLSFDSNNFGIVDELMGCVGAGVGVHFTCAHYRLHRIISTITFDNYIPIKVFPCAAVLNHSCVPNCILRYRPLFQSEVILQIAEIVAITDIPAGTELTHSYTGKYVLRVS